MPYGPKNGPALPAARGSPLWSGPRLSAASIAGGIASLLNTLALKAADLIARALGGAFRELVQERRAAVSICATNRVILPILWRTPVPDASMRCYSCCFAGGTGMRPFCYAIVVA